MEKEKLVKYVSEKTGLTTEEAEKAVMSVVEWIKLRKPEPVESEQEQAVVA